MTFRLSVPGNLLLAGEYAVLEPGGLGLALGVEPRLTVTASWAADWSLEGHWEGGAETWVPGAKPTFAALVLLKALELVKNARPARLVIDSTAFFDQGRKRGFGSSAALAAGVTAAVAKLAGAEPDCQTAVAAHRHAQGGRGSGYDVIASWFGDYGLFSGGVQPTWQPLDASSLPRLGVFAGKAPVSTVSSVSLYSAWKAQNPEAATRFLTTSNAAVDALSKTTDSEWFEAAARVREIGQRIGADIGSSAELTPPAGLDRQIFVKALGAGNETGLVAYEPFSTVKDLLSSANVVPLALSRGLLWE